MIVASAALLLVLSIIGSLASTSHGVQGGLRACRFCKAINCIEIGGWWSCCIAALPGSCVVEAGTDTITGVCNISGMPLYSASCDVATDPACVWDPTTTAQLCKRLCFDC